MVEHVQLEERMIHRPVKIDIAGAGNIADRYLAEFQRNPLVEVVAISDVIRERAEARASEFGIDRVMDPYDMAFRSEADMMLIITPPQAHANMALEAMLAGKHVYTEKPLATTFDMGQKMLAVSEKTKRRLGCAPETFLTPTFQLAKKLLYSGKIGRPYAVEVNFAGNGPESWGHPDPKIFYTNPGGPMYDMSGYYLHVLINMFGPVEKVISWGSTPRKTRLIEKGIRKGESFEVDDGVYTHMESQLIFKNGVVVNFTSTFEGENDKPHFVVIGERGMMKLPDPNSYDNNPIAISTDPFWAKDDQRTWEEKRPENAPEVSRGFYVAQFASAAMSGEYHPLNADLGLHALEIVEQCHISQQSGNTWQEITSLLTRAA